MISEFFRYVDSALDAFLQQRVRSRTLENQRSRHDWAIDVQFRDGLFRTIRLEAVGGREEFCVCVGLSASAHFPSLSLAEFLLEGGRRLDSRAPLHDGVYESILSHTFLGDLYDGFTESFEVAAPSTDRLTHAILASANSPSPSHLEALFKTVGKRFPGRGKLSIDEARKAVPLLFGSIRQSTDWQFVKLLDSISERDIELAMEPVVANATFVLHEAVLPYMTGDVRQLPTALSA